MRLDIYLHADERVLTKLDQIVALITKQGKIMSQQVEDLKAAVEAENTVIDSAIQLLNGLSAQIADLKDDPIALQALADEVKAKSAALASAVTTNTPAA